MPAANGLNIDTAAGLPALLLATTQAAHRHIDHHPLLAPLVRPGLSWDHYGQVPRLFLSLYESLQPALAVAI